MADAELMITPDIALADLKRTLNVLDQAMEQAAKKSGKEFEQELDQGISAGIKRGLASARSAISRGFQATSGARGAVAGGLVGLLTAGLFESMNRADEAGELMRARLEESQADRLLLTGRDAGLSTVETAKFSLLARQGGLIEMEDQMALLNDITLKVNEAVIGEDPLLAQFAGLKGGARLSSVLASLANADPDQARVVLDKIGLGEEIPKVQAMLNILRSTHGDPTTGMISGANLLAPDEAANAEADRLQKEIRLAFRFREEQAQHQAKWDQKFLDAIEPGDIEAFFADQGRIASDQVKLVNTFQENLAAANEIRPRLKSFMDELTALTRSMVNNTAKLVEKVEQGGSQAVLRHLYETSETFGPNSGNKKGG